MHQGILQACDYDGVHDNDSNNNNDNDIITIMMKLRVIKVITITIRIMVMVMVLVMIVIMMKMIMIMVMIMIIKIMIINKTTMKIMKTRNTRKAETFTWRVHSESAYLRQNLMVRYLHHPQSFLKISWNPFITFRALC